MKGKSMTIKTQMKNAEMKNTEIYLCKECGATMRAPSGKRLWCECNPSNPFEMGSIRAYKASDRAMRFFQRRAPTSNP